LVALLATFLLLLSGFVIDFGQAYMSKRNLQKAADAGALAAAQVLTLYPGTCNSVIANSAAIAVAHAKADEYRRANRESYLPASAETEFRVRCDPALKVLVVEYGVEGTTSSAFGPLAGRGRTIKTSRRAEATVDVAPIATQNVRPLALCSAALAPPYVDRTGDFIRVYFPGNGTRSPAQCPKPQSPGNWWTLDCPEERSGATTVLEGQIKNGCQSPVKVIPGQANVSTPGSLTVVLEAACPSTPVGSATCMSGDPGNLDAGHIADSWKYLVEQQTESIFPVFCVQPQCTDDTSSGTGTNTIFPVYKMVSATVCGYHFSNREKYHSTTRLCAGNPYLAASDADGSNGNNYLVLKVVQARTSGSNVESECALGAGCDGGLRRTRLTR
uniref:pilus assembly protein TadG-related protein n=1 Tax=Nocardioides sp. TaxID=35761 RepID=UPI00286D9F99